MKQVIVLSVALTAALVGSYLTWTDTGEVPDGTRAAVYASTVTDLESLAWRTETRDVTVTKRSDARGEYFWVDSTERVVPKPAPELDGPLAPEDEGTDDEAPADGDAPADDAPADDAPADPAEGSEAPAIEEKRVSFLGSDAAVKLWEGYAPLMALRELPTDGQVSDETFGLAEPTGTIEVVRRGQTLTLTIGGETYGSKDRYVRYEGKTFLVDDGDLRPLQYATTRLVERSLYPQGEADIESIQVVFDGRRDTFVHQNRDDQTKAFWARGDKPDEQDDTVETWTGKLLKLKLRAYVDEAEVGPLEPVFTFEVKGGDSWPVTVLRSTTDDSMFYAKGDYNRSLVELTGSIAKNIVDDLPEIFVEE